MKEVRTPTKIKQQLQLISLIDLVDLIDMGKLALIWTSLNQKQKTLKMNLGKRLGEE